MNHDVVKSAPRFAVGDRVTVASPSLQHHGQSGRVTGVFTKVGRWTTHRTYVTLDSGARIAFPQEHFAPEEKTA